MPEQHLNFGRLPVNEVAYRGQTFDNIGDAQLTIRDVRIEGDSDFSVIQSGPAAYMSGYADCQAGAVLGGGGGCAVMLAFRPTSTGRHTAVLVVTDDVSDAPHRFVLTGEAYRPRAVHRASSST